MITSTTIPQQSQMILTLENDAILPNIKKALQMIKGVASVRVIKASDYDHITPSIRRKMNKARKEYENGETVSCNTPEEMQRYFDSL